MRILQNSYLKVKKIVLQNKQRIYWQRIRFSYTAAAEGRWPVQPLGALLFQNLKVRKSNKGSVKYEQNIQGHLQ